MLKLVKSVGWILCALAAISAFCAVLVSFDVLKEDQKGALFGFLMFTGMFGFPGALILWRTTRLEREQAFRLELSGFIRTHDRFTSEEMAQKVGRSVMEVEKLIAQIAHEDKMDLVFHRSDRTYLHRGRIAQTARVYEACPSCGAALSNEVALEGEQVICVYCNRVLS
jgi:hypothetical protein